MDDQLKKKNYIIVFKKRRLSVPKNFENKKSETKTTTAQPTLDILLMPLS